MAIATPSPYWLMSIAGAERNITCNHLGSDPYADARPNELVIVLLVVIIIFGPGRLSEIGGALGCGLREFRATQRDLQESLSVSPEKARPAAPTAEKESAA